MMKSRVLIIEDDELLKELYGLKLSNEGFDVEYASNGAEGLEKARNGSPAIILLDMMMPVMTGLEFLQAYRSNSNSQAKVIVLSNKSTLEEIREAKLLGAVNYLIKSQLTPDDVVQEVRKSVEGTQV